MKQINPSDIERIVSELVGMEPELGRDEAKLRELVSRLLAAKPNIKIDGQFVARLRQELIAGEKTPVANRIAGFNRFMSRLRYVLGGSAVVAAVALIAIVATAPKSPNGPAGKLAGLVTGEEIAVSGLAPLGPNAFGPLSAASGSPQESNALTEQKSASGFGGGGRLAAPQSMDATASVAIDGSVGMPAPEPEYEAVPFRYVGEPLPSFGEKMTVYRRVKELSVAPLAAAVASFNNGLVNLSKVSGLNVMSLSLRHKADGQDYWVYLDASQGTANINLDYGTRGYEPASPGSVVPDDRLIALANSFLDRYGVDRRGYAEPQVDQSWMAAYPAGERMATPDFVQVNYQLNVGGQPVVAWGNQPYGLQVTIDVGHMRVQNVYNIMTRRFESSDYALETDAARLVSAAEAGGLGGMFWVPKGSVSAIELGAPAVKYYQHYQYDERTGVSQELYVPTLFFPVLNAPAETGSYQQYVMVPLVKEILDAQQQDTIGIPTPYPLIMKAEGDGSSGSSGTANESAAVP